jgi:AraC family transcriptional regulator
MRWVSGADPWQPLDRVLFDGPLVRIGSFRVDHRHPRFHDSGPIENHVFVFPRTGVRIQHEGKPAFVADPNVVTFYNRGQIYRRDRITEEGDRCEWFSVAPEALLEAVLRFEHAAGKHPEQPFSMDHGPTEAEAYLCQRRLVQSLLNGRLDPLFVEEAVLGLLDRVLEAHYRRWDGPPLDGPGSEHRSRDLIEAARSLLAASFRGNVPLVRLAATLGVSAGHLCRTFRRGTGTTLHLYRDQLRLRTALEALPELRVDLTQLALELGYSSHSHFTERFRRAFGMTPSAFRDSPQPP